MKILTLSIKREYFDEIVAGTKTVEYRDIRPTTFKRYCRYMQDGKEFTEMDYSDEKKYQDVVLIKYDALKLVTGAYKDKRPYIIVAVTDSKIMFDYEFGGRPVIYEQDGQRYISAYIEYHLGEIIENKSNLQEKIERTLELKIKKALLQQIISGEKKEVWVSAKGYNIERLFKVDHTNETIGDREDLKEIKFVAGYAKDAEWAIVKVNDVEPIYIIDFVKNIPEGYKKGDSVIAIPIRKNDRAQKGRNRQIA